MAGRIGRHMRRLLGIVSPPLGDPADPAAAEAALAPLTVGWPVERRAELAAMYGWHNGFFAFESALHVLPLGSAGAGMDLSRWNAPDLWRDAYGGLADGRLFIAADGFGNPFCADADGYGSFNAETGEIEQIAPTLEGWVKALLDDFAFLTGHPLVHDWQARHGMLPAGQRLTPRRPFVLGGGYDIDNLVAMDAAAYMRLAGRLAVLLRDLPDGASLSWPPEIVR